MKVGLCAPRVYRTRAHTHAHARTHTHTHTQVNVMALFRSDLVTAFAAMHAGNLRRDMVRAHTHMHTPPARTHTHKLV